MYCCYSTNFGVSDNALEVEMEVEAGARNKFVESLAKMVEDRHRDLLKDAEQDGQLSQRVEAVHNQETSVSSNGDNRAQSGYGFINQLQRLRGS